MSTPADELVRMIGAVIEGYNHASVMDALCSIAMMQVVNNSDSLSEAIDKAQQLSNEIINLIPTAYEVLEALDHDHQ